MFAIKCKYRLLSRAGKHLVFTLEQVKYHLVDTKAAVACFMDPIFIDGKDIKFRLSCLVLN